MEPSDRSERESPRDALADSLVRARANGASPADGLVRRRVLAGLFGGRERPIRWGPYVLVRQLGAGGGGVVFAAYDPRLDREVALKLLPTESDETRGAATRARLVSEARALASLSHPNVVAVYDVGVIEDQVFVAMELVDGDELGSWVGRQCRGWREVLRTFVEAGRGLAAAHDAGLVHRDFKPSNVLVGRDARPRVIDFGLAERALASETSPEASSMPGSRGAVGPVIGTPAYMAPEQHEGRPASAASDQFSFCFALYEALYAERPFKGSTAGALHRAIVAAQVRPVPVGTRVPGWLRRILLRGLEADPRRRWPSMVALLGALRRGRARTLRRAAMSAAAIALVAGLGFGIALRGAGTGPPCSGASAKLANAWSPARRAAVQAAFEATERDFAPAAWTGVDRAIAAYVAQWRESYTDACEATHVRNEQPEAMMDLRMACLERRRWELEALTEVLAEADAAVVERAFEATLRLSPLARCSDTAALAADVDPPRDLATAGRVEALRRRLAEARALDKAGRYQAAAELARSLTHQARSAGYDPVLAEALLRLGRVQNEVGDAAGAEESLTEAAWIADLSSHDQVAAEAKVRLTYVVGYLLRRNEDAREWARHAQAAVRRVRGGGALEADLHNSVAIVMTLEARYAEAIEAFTRSIQLREQTLGPDHPDVAESESNLAVALVSEGRDVEAAGHADRALRIYEAALGPDHPEVAHVLHNLATTVLRLGEAQRSMALWNRAIAIFERANGPDHPNVAQSLASLGATLTRHGPVERAREPLNRALAIYERAHGSTHPSVAQVLLAIGDLEVELGSLPRARAAYTRAVAVLELGGGGASAGLVATSTALAQTQFELGELSGSIETYARAIAAAQLLPASQHRVRLTANAQFGLARALWARDPDRARALATEAAAHYAGLGARSANRRSEVDRWLSAHPPV